MLKSLVGLSGLLIFGLVSPVSAQIIFEPVQYQYGSNPSFYYGGTNPRVFEFAARTVYFDGIAGPAGARYHIGTPYYGKMGSQPPAVFSDRLPHVNAALFHYTPADARNDANATVPTYFRKIDLLRAAIPSGDGRSWIVPAQAPLPQPSSQIDIRPWTGHPAVPSTRPATTGPSTTQPSTQPQPLLIIPKSSLQGPLQTAPRPLAS